jgi:hypothetical protein
MKNFAKVLAVAAWGMAAAAMAAPDLVISSVTLSTNRAYPGDKVTINSVTRNNGDATGWWKYCDVYYYWGTAGNLRAQKIGSGATPNYNEVNGIDKGEEEEDTLSWTIPAGTAPGIYYITCVADAEGEIAESNEGNNTKSVKFTVIGTPSFSGLKWGEPMYVSGGDPVTLYGECANVAKGTFLTVQIYEDDVAGDDLMATVYPQVKEASDGSLYFTKSWTAVYTNDASGDPEYYFKVSYTQDGKTYTAESGRDDGTYLHVSQDRMKPSYASGKNDFYYDNVSTNDPGFVGASSGTVKLTDDRIPLILVHGMGGDGKPNTLNYWYGWMNADANYPLGYFNQAPLSSMFRVYRYVYDTRDFISTNGVRLANFVNSFYASHPEFEGRQVVVMAHSMGGLVSRYAMNVNTQFAARVHRLVTLGSPHLGAQGANPTWIKYSGPNDNSWFISSIYNTFDLHNNTAGCFDLAWYATNEIPAEALTESAISDMGDSYNTDLLRKSIRTPFTGWAGMRSKSADNKCVLFGGSSTNQIGDNLRPSWIKAAASEVSTDHLGLWVATKIYRSMSYADGTGVGDNDGLVPLISALMSDSLKCALASDKNGHPTAAKFNLNELDGQQVDHASYLDVPVTMDAVKAVLLTQVRGYCQPAAVTNSARWCLVDNTTGETSPWQRTSVRLPALVPGRSYTVKFKEVSGYTTPKSVTFTATKAVTRQVSGTYTTASAANHAPSELSLSNASVAENMPIGTVVGTFSAYDEDGDSLTYSLVAGDGDTGNACFTIDGNQLKTAQKFDYEQYPKHYCRVRVSDGTAFMEEAFTIDVVDVDETPAGAATGDAWLNLSWDAVPGADYYEVDVTAGTTASVYPTPNQSLGTNQFLAGQFWRYEAPGGATTTTSGSVKTSPCWFTYGTTNAHALFGTNGMALVTQDLPLLGATAATIDFTHGNWNGGGDTNVSLIDAYYRIDGGEWQPVASSVATAPRDGGEVSFWQDDFIEPPQGASTIAFKLEAPNAWRNDWQRGPYVTGATASLYGQGDFDDADAHLVGYPRFVNTTNIQIQMLPADTSYWWRVTAHVGTNAVDVSYGHGKTEDTVPAPTGLSVATASSTELTATWTDPGQVDHFEVELTPVVAAGTETTLASVPNVNLSGAANASGWRYSANHTVVSNDWICATTNTEWDYHGLVVKTLPGVQSPELDLSGCESATVRFVARARGTSADGIEGVSMVLYYKLPEGDWTAAGSVTTNSIYINNNKFLYLDVPAEALVDGVKLEIGVPGATSTGSVWSGTGNGVRNITLLGVGKPAPDYGAETAITLEPVPAPLANAVEAAATTNTTASGLAMDTPYFLHVRSVDAWGHASAWVEAGGRTAAASAPSSISLSSRSIRENNAVGAYIGLLSAVDADAGDEITYELADGEGADDNALVEVRGATVRAAASFKADGKVRRIRVRATDAQGLWTEQAFDIEVLASATPPAGVLVDAETLAAMSAACGVRIVAVEGDGKGGLKTAWEDAAPAGARAVRQYDIYVSTNLTEGFTFYQRVEGTAATVSLDGPARFWTVLTAE